jgi:hypothetical protein
VCDVGDQAHLSGLLDQVRDLGMELLVIAPATDYLFAYSPRHASVAAALPIRCRRSYSR